MGRPILAGAALLAVAVAPLRAAEKASPELPFVEWTEGRATLEDYKGLLTAIVFFSDSRG